MENFVELLSGQKRGIWASLTRSGLWCASKAYGLAAACRNWAYNRKWLTAQTSPIPVISVGNLTVGGTGKTPAVAMLARYLREKGIRVAIVSRGYGSHSEGMNDEAKELDVRLPDVPHFQNPDRIASIRIAVEELDSQLILLDDGFQHRKVARQLDIVLLDAIEPFGFDHLLPRGLLREPIGSLRRADVVMVTRADQVDAQRLAEIRVRVQRFAPSAAWIETEHKPIQLRNSQGEVERIEWLQGKKVFAFCGIGNPRGFFATIQQLKANTLQKRIYPDHHEFSAFDIQELQAQIRSLGSIDAVLCTGKDLPKIGLDQLADIPLWAVDIELTVRVGIEPLQDRLEKVIQESGIDNEFVE